MKTLAVFHLKGGVGKTTSAVNLAYCSAQRGQPTLLWDLDPQGSASWYLGVNDDMEHTKALKILKGKEPVGQLRFTTPYKRLSVIPADTSLRKQDLFLGGEGASRKTLARLVSALGESQSVVLFDCPPALSDLAENIFSAVDVVLLPMIPSPLSLRAYQQVVEFLDHKRWKKLRLLPFFTMVDRRRKLHNDILAAQDRLLPGALKTYIPYASLLEQMGIRRAPLGEFAAQSPAAVAYDALWCEVMEQL